MLKRGGGDNSDIVRDNLERLHPRIHIQDIDCFEFSTFNRAVSDNLAMLSAECWSGAHPLPVTISVDWEYTVPYALIYAKVPAEEVLRFITAIGKVN